jgi:hypothetical protein
MNQHTSNPTNRPYHYTGMFKEPEPDRYCYCIKCRHLVVTDDGYCPKHMLDCVYPSVRPLYLHLAYHKPGYQSILPF